MSGGDDSVVMIWKSHLNQFEQEVIDDFGGRTTAVCTATKALEAEAAKKPVPRKSRTTADMYQDAQFKCTGKSRPKVGSEGYLHCH